MATIYALQYHDDPFCLPALVDLATTKEDAREKIETLHNLDPEQYNKNDVHITVFKVDMKNGVVCKGETFIGIKELL